ncbi:MAG: tyrosine--tRNA ligase, partial [Alphaproteobacteria bacterium]
MSRFRSEFLQALEARGFVHQITDPEGLDRLAAAGPITGYIGFDCTAASLHIGNLVSIMLLRHLQDAGHRPIALVGGGTSKVGDPSFRDEARKLLDDDAIAANKAGIRRSLAAFLDVAGGRTLMVDNAEWLDELRYVPFLRDIGRHFTVNRMLTFDSVRLRLEREQPLTFLEFNYMLMQAYDFTELARRYGCRLQMGGSDQWGNIVNGIELNRRLGGEELYGVTTPLITKSSGEKMGKSVQGAIWLNADKLDPFDYWQFWRNTEDADVGRFLRLFTLLPLDEIARLEALAGAEINEAKKVLATEATRLAHGDAAAEQARGAAAAVFEQAGAEAGLPEVAIDRTVLAQGLAVVDALVDAGLARTKGEARRLIRGGGAKRRVPHFDDLLFLGASISRYPLEGYREKCETAVTLGTRFAKKPIELKIP